MKQTEDTVASTEPNLPRSRSPGRSEATRRLCFSTPSPERRCSAGSESDSPSPSRPRSNSPPTKSRWRRDSSPPPVDSHRPFTVGKVAPILEGKVLFIFFRFSIRSPFPYCLIRFSLPDLSTCSETKQVSPVLQFPAEDFPVDMRCVEVDSKFYFLGGEWLPGKVANPNYTGFIPPQVYYVDADTLAGNTINHPNQVLKAASPMNSGKPDPYTFAAYGKIYVIGGRDDLVGINYDEYVEFEVYDPKHDEWTEMPEPPMTQLLRGHAVVGRDVFVVTDHAYIFCFNVDTKLWTKFPASLPCRLYEDFVFETKGEVVDDTLYGCNNSVEPARVVAYCKGDDESKGLFDHVALLSPESRSAYEWHVHEPSHYMVHLGQRMFCHVIAGTAPYLPDGKYLHRLGIHLNLIEVGETYKTTDQFGDDHFFRAKLLQDAFLVTPSSELPLIQSCFLVSSRGTVAAR